METRNARLSVVETGIALARVLVELAEIEHEFDDMPGLTAALAKAEQACEAASRFIGVAENCGQAVEPLEVALNQVLTRIELLRIASRFPPRRAIY